jgi:hypothetical protein
MRTGPLLKTVAVACLVAAVGCFAVAWGSAGHRHLVPFAAPVPPMPIRPLADPAKVDLTSRPVKVAIPAVGLSARVVPVGLTRSGHIKMPAPSVAGWYRWGPAPDEPGPAVLVGHVDSHHGPAAFYRLSGVQVGELVHVARADGSSSSFTISKITVASKSAFPTQAVYGATGRPSIRLITCTGAFDTSTGYADSLIIWGHATTSH